MNTGRDARGTGTSEILKQVQDDSGGARGGIVQDCKDNEVLKGLSPEDLFPGKIVNQPKLASRAAIPRPGKPLFPFPFSGVPMTPGATHRVVGYLPGIDTQIKVFDGLFVVIYVNSGKGRFTAIQALAGTSLPEVGDECTVHGLRYRVTQRREFTELPNGTERARFTAEIIKGKG